jgi:carbonic anhydrase
MRTLVVILALIIYQAYGEASWDYAQKGPSTWGDYCKGSSQSPINIVTCDAERSSFANRIFSHNYWKSAGGQKYVMKNNGHALQVDLPKDTPYKLKKGQKEYVPIQLHLHFDGETMKGSEHTVNSKQYFAEIHIVHRNARYETKEQIMGNKDGLLVIGIFVDLVKGLRFRSSDLDFSMSEVESQMKTPNDRTSFAMQLFGNAAKKLQKPNSKATIDGFPLSWLLPRVNRGGKSRSQQYINYKGSLTTPPCSEIVDWIVITGRTLEVNEKTARDFKAVRNSQGSPMSGNFRPVQDVNGREIYGVKGML